MSPFNLIVRVCTLMLLAVSFCLAGAVNGFHLYADERVAAKSTSSYEIEFDPGEADVRLMFYGMDCVIAPAIFDQQGRTVEVIQSIDKDEEGCVSIARWQVAKRATYVIKIVNGSDSEVEYAMSNN